VAEVSVVVVEMVETVVVAVPQRVVMEVVQDLEVVLEPLLPLILGVLGKAARLIHHFQPLLLVVLEEIYQGHQLHLVVDLAGMPTTL
jgi:hypothetical protein